MAQCNFSIQVGIPAEEIAKKAESAIMGAGGNFNGNAGSGNFNVPTPVGTIRGSYVIQHPVIHISIDSKPFLVSCAMIEKQLRGYFASVVA